MSGATFDVVFVGGGHNGLVAATRLARSGLRVLVLEAASEAGGAAAAHAIHPGFRVPALAHVLPALDRRARRQLALGHPGPWPGTTRIALLPDAPPLPLDPAPRRAAQALRGRSPADARAWPVFLRRLEQHAATLRPLLEGTPPRLDPARRGDLLALARLGWSIRRRGRARMRELLRIITMNVADLLDEHFESDPVKGVFALEAVLGTNHGPRSPNTVFTLLHRIANQPATGPAGAVGPAAGVGQPVEALLETAHRAGVQVHTGQRVARILVQDGSARGVELADGRVIESGRVVSNADPVTTLGDLVGGDHLDADFLATLRALRTRGTTGKVNFALDRAPALPTGSGGGPVRWLLSPSVDYVEAAFDHVKYGEAVPQPALEITVPSLDDPSCAPEGQHVMSVNVAYAPYGAEHDPAELGATVTRLIEQHVPGFAESVLACEAWGPREIETRFGIRGGHWHHVDIALDQFFLLRPVPGWAGYRTPVDGLYLCGAGTHPGGGVTGTNGLNAAREILRDRRRGRRAA